MPARQISDPASGERLLGIEPQLLQQVDPGWRHRLNLFTGRALSDTALDAEQLYRAGLLATLGQAVTAGTVNGLVLTLDAQPADPVLTVTPGYGLCASGEDVSLQRTLQTNLSTLVVLDPVTGDVQQPFSEYRQNAANAYAGVLVLQPIVAQVSGRTFDTGTGPIEVSGNLGASCDQDPDEYAFEDWQIADGARLAFVAWPNGVASLQLPPPDPAATLRNRLAYAIFDAEAQLGPDGAFPWSMLGVPVALVAFDAAWKPLFADGSSVVRPGGLPRRYSVLPSSPPPPPPAGLLTWRANEQYATDQSIVDPSGNVQTVLVAGRSGPSEPAWNDPFLETLDAGVTWVNNGTTVPPIVQPALAQARVAQLAEQVGDRLGDTSPFTNLADICAVLPPSGVLPVAAVDLVNKRSAWLPRNWSISAAPVHVEELEAVLRTGMLADPIPALAQAPGDPAQTEPVEVLVPLADELYDPDILVTETVSPEFQHEIDAATRSRDATLRTRKTVQLQLNALAPVARTSYVRSSRIDLDAGLTPAERAGRDRLPPFLPQAGTGASLDVTYGTIGPATWRPDTQYTTGQFVYDPDGNVQRVQSAGGTSQDTQPGWNATAGGIAQEGAIVWFNAGSSVWQPNTAYASGQFVFDANGALQSVETPGTSGASQYIWNAQSGARTTDGGVVWINGGPAWWQANRPYTAGTAIVDRNGNLQVVESAGTSGRAQPGWATDEGEGTPDGAQLVWINEGVPTIWEPNTPYAPHQIVVDPARNLQEVATAGTSGSSQLIWNMNSGQLTRDGATLTWVNGGPGKWQADTAYTAGQFVIDANGNAQSVTGAGTSGAAAPPWSAAFGQTTADGTVTWFNDGPGTWRANTAFAAGQFVFAPNGTIQTVLTAGTSGSAAPAWPLASGQQTTDGSVTWLGDGWLSADVQALRAQAAAPPYTVTYTMPNREDPTAIGLIGADDWADLEAYGLQHFIDRLNAKIKRANDLLDLGFLTSQTDIYRFRQNVLSTIDASRLATSPVLANIATGETASATAEQLRDYLGSATTTTAAAPASATQQPAVTAKPAVSETANESSVDLTSERAELRTVSGTSSVELPKQIGTPALRAKAVTAALAATPELRTTTTLTPVRNNLMFETPSVVMTRPAQIVHVTTPSRQDITEQSPLVGAQIDVRTITIAERLTQPKSQEALFYAVSNRTAFLQALAALEITVDDLQFFADNGDLNPDGTIHIVPHVVSEMRDADAFQALLGRVQSPYVPANADEAAMFSTGIRVVEQHTQLMRALEGRVQQYADFVALCTSARSNVQADVAGLQTRLAQLENDLAQQRQNLAFTSALLGDEQQRVANVNARRTQILQTSVQLVVYTRPRTLESTQDVPSRQLVPGDVISAVPACLAQPPEAVPPELREIVALLREAPLAWIPSVRSLLDTIGQPSLLYQIATFSQAHATVALQVPQTVSSAVKSTGVYAPAIAAAFSANQQTITGQIARRTTSQPAALLSMSWSAQVATLGNVLAIGDLIASNAAHAEVANATSRLVNQISSVATCMYGRANLALPADRLAWAEYLRGPGAGVQLRSLAILPNWNTQAYLDRQQMQSLADWLFAQIDVTDADAVAYVSDVIRTAILLASHAPVNAVVAGAVALAKQPALGGVIALTAPPLDVAAGMHVQLYSKGTLAAEAVVSDLHGTSVSATFTAVHSPGILLEQNDVVHFTAQPPLAAALTAFAQL